MKAGLGIVGLWFVTVAAALRALTILRERRVQIAELGFGPVVWAMVRRWIPTVTVLAVLVAVVILDPGHGAP